MGRESVFESIQTDHAIVFVLPKPGILWDLFHKKINCEAAVYYFFGEARHLQACYHPSVKRSSIETFLWLHLKNRMLCHHKNNDINTNIFNNFDPKNEVLKDTFADKKVARLTIFHKYSLFFCCLCDSGNLMLR